MKITSFSTYNSLSDKASSIVLEEIRSKPGLLLCAATGSSPLGLYSGLAYHAQEHPNLFSKLRIIKLDEWVGISPDAEASCEGYLQKHLIRPLNISGDSYFAFDPLSIDIEKECFRMQKILMDQGPIDLCILGLGKNGHLGFNEPGATLEDHCHGVKLSTESRSHYMVSGLSDIPTHGITLGMKDILASKRILIIISGGGKEEAKTAFLSRKVSNACPATHLWNHTNVDCLVLE